MDFCISCNGRIIQLENSINFLKREVLRLQAKLEDVKTSQYEPPSLKDDTELESLDKLNVISPKSIICQTVETSDFEDDPNEEASVKDQLENTKRKIEDYVIRTSVNEDIEDEGINPAVHDDFENEERTEEVIEQQNLSNRVKNDKDLIVDISTSHHINLEPLDPPHDNDRVDFNNFDSAENQHQQSSHYREQNNSEKSLTRSFTQTEQAIEQEISSNNVIGNQNISVETSTNQQITIQEIAFICDVDNLNDGDDEDSDDDSEDEEWQCMHCKDLNSIEEYFCFTCALTQIEEVHQENSFENKARENQETFTNQQIKVRRIVPLDYDDFDDGDSDDFEEEEWQCMHCKDWNSVEEYFCFTCALTQTEEAYAKMK